jgi:alpha-L-fucosidase 2
MKRLYYLALVLISFSTLPSFGQKSLRLWYEKPAQVWEETLPLGNGRLGMMPDGGIMKEKIVLNDITLWSGASQDANNYNAYKQLPQIRQLLSDGKNDEAQALIDKDFVCTGQGSGGPNWGCYQTLANLEIEFDYNKESKPANYKRELSLQNAMARCSYEINNVMYTREYFTSFDDDVNVIRITANKPGMLNCHIGINREERATVKTDGTTLQLSGQLDNGINGKGMQYTAKVKALLKGGKLSAVGNEIIIKNATEIIIYVSATTDFRSPAYIEQAARLLNKSMQKPYELQKKNHITVFQKLFNRVNLSIGTTNADNLPTDKRLVAFHKNPDADNALAVLFYQFGRYLSISSTRVGLLPPNLQGLWANQVHTPWNGDYHLDINVQMNHWPLEAANLSELNLPLAELVKGLVRNGEKTAKAYYNADGWVAHVITNVWGFTEPGESASWGISKSGSGWLCNNLWEHYAFTSDKKYLRSIYPVLKGSAQFYNSILIKDDKTGWMVTSPSSSPENSFYLPDGRQASICIGAAIDNQIIRELFTNVIRASRQLGVDAAFRKELQEKLAMVPPAVIISKDGRIQEWLEDYKETDPRHRHISHLYGLYPASLITPETNREWVLAAKKTLNSRGDDGPSWSIAYKLLFWARLQDGNRAYKLFTEIMKPTIRTDINYGAGGGIYPNLLSAGPPFQIDGNFGTTAGIGEMLVQSHAGFIDLIPAIPDAWKVAGEAKGLKARGNFKINMKWKDGKVTTYTISSPQPRKVKVRINGVIKEVMAKKDNADGH